MSTYVFDNAWQQARQRLGLLEQCLDPATFRRMNALGVRQGWQCLEVGAGGGSVAQWLCAQVGPTGRVMATDVDTRFLEALNKGNLEVRRHNLTSDDLPENSFDLIHSRLVLMHIPAREEILPRLVSALKPGGWLLLEEHDIYPVLATAAGSYQQVWAAVLHALVQAGGVPDWGRHLPHLLTKLGLQEGGAEGDIPIFAGTSPMARFWSLSWEQLRGRMLAAGIDQATLSDVEAALADSTQWFTGPAIIAAWGRRPS